MSDEEEMVAVRLGDDYYQGPYFVTKETDSSGTYDYLVPRSQLERWEEALAAYGQMQDEVLAVMSEQRQRVLAARSQRPQSPISKFIQQAYERRLVETLLTQVSLRGPNYKDPEDDTPRLVTDAKIDREEEERGL